VTKALRSGVTWQIRFAGVLHALVAALVLSASSAVTRFNRRTVEGAQCKQYCATDSQSGGLSYSCDDERFGLTTADPKHPRAPLQCHAG
jgi:hypothetical protein